MTTPPHSEPSLDVDGFVVVPVVPPHQVRFVFEKFIKAILSAPELARLPPTITKRLRRQDPTLTKDDLSFVGGSFGALGNPSSFHHPTIRKLRAFCTGRLIDEVFGAYLEADPLVHYQAVIDRAMVRLGGNHIGAETEHRDIDPSSLNDDSIVAVFGGWLNLSFESDTFYCIPGTHTDTIPPDGSAKGFFKIPKNKLHEYKGKCVGIDIPPGHAIVFNERILHRVNPSKAAKYRLFLGHRLTTGPKDIDSALYQQLETMAPVRLKSGQDSRMWPLLWWTNWRTKLPLQARALVNPMVYSRCTETRTVKNGPDTGKEYTCIKPVMPSLSTLYDKLPFPVYTPSELQLYRSSRSWAPRIGGSVVFTMNH